ncbi:MAG: L,D-transpeptidase family protein [Bacteroidetes bacterium]|nr:L,D-transpeptidase family protein [Bacteroidota bacterium]
MKKFQSIFLIFFIWACSIGTPEKEQSFLKNKNLSEKEKLERVLDVEYLKTLKLNQNEIGWVKNIYSKSSYRRFFATDSCLKNSAFDLQCELDRSIWYGIPKIRLHSIKNKKLHPIEKEVLLMLNFGRMISDLNYGFFDFQAKRLKDLLSNDFNPIHFLKQTDTISFTRLFQKQGPADTNYRFLAYNLYHYSKNHKIDTTEFKISIKSKPEKIFEEAKKSLLSKGWINDKMDSLEVSQKLKLFQLENGLAADGKLGENTIYAINESTYEKLLRASLTLDRYRSATKNPKKFVRVNIPEFKLYFYANDTLRNIHRIIVGKQTNPTPQLESKIYRIICHPYWKVPQSIATKEILPAQKANRNYLTKNHYKIYKGQDQEVDPYSVNWGGRSSMPYTVIQQPGSHNSLGIIKFEFNNSFSVYVHDTPKKSLFNTVFRSYSHGCMRCENPVDLAKSILTFDSIPRKVNPYRADTLDSLLAKRNNIPISLIEPIPIYVVYETVVAERNSLIFHLDLYRREEELVKVLKGEK